VKKWVIFGVKKVVPIFVKKWPFLGYFLKKVSETKFFETLEGIIYQRFPGFLTFSGYFLFFQVTRKNT